jgi:MoaA/NifB/PqqE/SkfB family radical SAM enzyme
MINQNSEFNIYPSFDCFFNCIYCTKEPYKTGKIDIEDLKEIFNIVSSRYKRIRIKGEIFAYPQISEVIPELSQFRRITFETTASEIDERLYQKIKRMLGKKARFSIDIVTDDNKRFTEITNNKRFKETIQNYERIRKDFITEIQTTLHRINYTEKETISNIIYKYKEHDILLNRIVGRDGHRSLLPTYMHNQNYLYLNEHQKEEINSEIERYGLKKGMFQKTNQAYKCPYLKDSAYCISNKGVHPCPQCLDVIIAKKDKLKYIIESDSLWIIWEKLRQKILKGIATKFFSCPECEQQIKIMLAKYPKILKTVAESGVQKDTQKIERILLEEIYAQVPKIKTHISLSEEKDKINPEILIISITKRYDKYGNDINDINNKNQELKDTDLSFRKIENICYEFNSLDNKENKIIEFGWKGDPFLHNKIENIIALIQKLNIYSVWTIHTDAILKHIHTISANMAISCILQGPNEKIHDSESPSRTFLKILRTMHILRSMHIPFDVIMQVTKTNYPYIEETYKLARHIGCNEFNIVQKYTEKLYTFDNKEREIINKKLNRLNLRKNTSFELSKNSECIYQKKKILYLNNEGSCYFCHILGDRPNLKITDYDTLADIMHKNALARESINIKLSNIKKDKRNELSVCGRCIAALNLQKQKIKNE